MKDGDAVGLAFLDAPTCSAFEDDDHGSGESTGSRRSPNLLDEGSGRSRSIPPPSVWPGPNHVRRIDQKHQFSITVSAGCGTSAQGSRGREGRQRGGTGRFAVCPCTRSSGYECGSAKVLPEGVPLPGRHQGQMSVVVSRYPRKHRRAAYHRCMLHSLTVTAVTCQKASTGASVAGLVIILAIIGAIVGFAIANARARKQLALANYELNYLRPENARLKQWLASGTASAGTPVTGYGVGASIPPQWHPDPTGRHELRFWNGTDWTDDVSDGGVAHKEA